MKPPSLEPLSHATRPFDYHCRTRLVFGEHTVDAVGEMVRELGGTRVLLVSDPGIARAGHVGRVRAAIEAAGAGVTLFEDAEENPTTRCVDKCVAVARAAKVDLIVGLGGGSSMDTAKGCNFILTNGGEMRDYWGVGKARLPMLPLIAIPTTGGTGSECQSFALISDAETHRKMACGDPKAAARIAILDPTLTVSQPPRVTACTGIDAVAHAVESAVTRKRTPLSLMFSREAFKSCTTGFPRVLSAPSDLEARGAMLMGAAWAGTAIENSMLGAAHSSANPLTARHGVVHGMAVGLMLPHIVRFNAENAAAADTYADLARSAGIQAVGSSKETAQALAKRITELLELAQLPTRLRDHGIPEEHLPLLAEAATQEWTAHFNPRPITAADFHTLYRAAW